MIKVNKITKRLGIWAVVVGLILMIPLLTKAPWSKSDFIFAGGVLFGAAVVYELVTKNMSNKKIKIAAGIGVLGFLVLVQAWAATGPD